MTRNHGFRLGVIVVMVAVITLLHYTTNIHEARIHDIYRRLYYLPIILGGLWFTLRGGLATALAVSLLFIPHVVFQWQHHPTVEPEQYLEIILYNVIGALTGFLAGREAVQKTRYREAAEQLEASYAELKRQSDQILEIEEQLRRADRLSALGELSAGMAHEIRNPLGSIRGTAEILRDGIPPDDPRAEFATILIREVDRLNRVVQDILDFAQPPVSDRQPVDLVASLQEVLLLTRQQARKQGVQVMLRGESHLQLAVQGEQFKQVFLNLILNALQALPQGGTLEIAVVRRAEQAVLTFRDNGPGIAADDLQRIFAPFFTTRRDGTGLGLAITQRIVQAHGGRIEVQSAVGSGTTFTLWLPLPTEVRA